MGLSALGAEFLAEARASGVRFHATATIGRQALLIGPLRLRRTLRRHGLPADVEYTADGPWADPFLSALGATRITAIDASDYEGADLLHDLNEPVPAELHERFDVVLDAGSLEHVFNVATALRSLMLMTSVGGRVILVTPANNHCGHGLFQFSPELFQRVFCADNGFELERIQIAEHDVRRSRKLLGAAVTYELAGRRHDVADPRAMGERVLLSGGRPATLLVQARRVRGGEVFERWPQQSDYVAAWAAAPVRGGRAGLLLRRHLTPARRATLTLDVLPALLPLLDPLRHRREARRRSLRNRRFYR